MAFGAGATVMHRKGQNL